MSEKSYQRTRSDHALELAEDYVEAIADAISERGVCRAVDLVATFAVTHATVNNTIGRLQRNGLVQSAPYQPIELTSKGKRLAAKSRNRHQIVEAFLRKIGVAEQTAAIDSEGMEHHVSGETLAAMKGILDNGWPT